MRWCPAVFIVVAALAGAAPAHADVVKLADDSWEVEDSLGGVRPAEGETVRWLTVRRIGPDSPEGLRPLSGFRDLRVLELEVVSGVDLTPLAGLRLDHLSLRYVRDVDLAPLGSLRGLKA